MDGQQQYADAMRAFDAYYGTRRSAFGLDWPTKRYAEHRSWKAFMKVAARCAEKRYDVERYVTVVLGHMQKNGTQVIPNDLLTSKAETVWQQHRNDRGVDAGTKWAHYVRTVIALQGTSGMSDEAIMLDAFVQLPAWFRVLYPEHVDDKIVAKWGEEALECLRVDRDLVRFLRAAMPAKMEAFEKKMGVIDGL